MGRGEEGGRGKSNQNKTRRGGGVGGVGCKLHTLLGERKAAPNCCQQLSLCTISLPYGPISTSEQRFLAQQLHTNRVPSISGYIFRHFFFLLKFPLPFSLMGKTHPSCRDQVQQKASWSPQALEISFHRF